MRKHYNEKRAEVSRELLRSWVDKTISLSGKGRGKNNGKEVTKF